MNRMWLAGLLPLLLAAPRAGLRMRSPPTPSPRPPTSRASSIPGSIPTCG